MAERRYRIHPAIGVARVGNADRTGNDFFFIGPEIPEVPPNFDTATNTYRDFKTAAGKIKPQAARFRIFEYEKGADGKFHPIGEIGLGDGRTTKMTWTVHVANRKANFCDFRGQDGALANPFFSNYAAADVRNKEVTGLANRHAKLDLDPGPRSIDGGDGNPKDFVVNRPPLAIDTLGQIRSDETGRLIFIGGKGRSGFDPNIPRGDGGEPGDIVSYANNDGWFDDVSDGPVQATITIDGAEQSVEAAWVVVGPPDFAPSVRSYRSMYDTLVDVIVREIPIPADDGLFAGPLADIAEMQADWDQATLTLPAYKPSFTRHIYPILSSIARVARIYRRGPPGNPPDNNFHAVLNPLAYDELGGSNSDPDRREGIFVMLRDPKKLLNNVGPPEPKLMPLILGDYYGAANGRGGEDDPAFFHSVSLLQYELLRAWRDGRFIADWVGVPPVATVVTPEGIDRAALENVVGGGFFPGIEAGWLSTKAKVYKSPFRVAAGAVIGKVPVPQTGAATSRDLVLEAGAFSQQMALPWQADFRDCRSETHTIGGLTKKAAWWPVQRPDEVFPDTSPTKRVTWARKSDGTGYSYEDMINNWSDLGFVVQVNNNLFEVDGPPPLIG
jgi:L-lysine epsilon oxidase-like protein